MSLHKNRLSNVPVQPSGGHLWPPVLIRSRLTSSIKKYKEWGQVRGRLSIPKNYVVVKVQATVAYLAS